MNWFDGRRKLLLTAIFVAASAAIIFGVVYLYLNYYQTYALVTIAQVDPRLFEPWPPYAEFSVLPDEVLGAYPKLKGAFGEVNEEFERVVSECPPNEAVYCDLASNTGTTFTINANELHSLLRSSDLLWYGTIPDRQWIAFFTRDDCYSMIPFFAPDELATAYRNGTQKCYYTIKLDVRRD